MTMSIRINDDDARLVKMYCALHNISISDLFRQAVIEKIEDEYDLKCYEEAMKKFEKDPATYSLDEVEKELGLR
ncbi:MAG: CopG family transcriptional regulator [Clostridiales bacterium]|nr:CopG family transcriptional regulator [Clostridiales bacterium]